MFNVFINTWKLSFHTNQSQCSSIHHKTPDRKKSLPVLRCVCSTCPAVHTGDLPQTGPKTSEKKTTWCGDKKGEGELTCFNSSFPPRLRLPLQLPLGKNRKNCPALLRPVRATKVQTGSASWPRAAVYLSVELVSTPQIGAKRVRSKNKQTNKQNARCQAQARSRFREHCRSAARSALAAGGGVTSHIILHFIPLHTRLHTGPAHSRCDWPQDQRTRRSALKVFYQVASFRICLG